MLSQDNSGQSGIGSSADPNLPVFVDSTGRRARIVQRTWYGLAGAAAAYLAVLALTLMGATPFAPSALLPPLPGEATAPAMPEPQGPDGETLPPSGVLDPGRIAAGDVGGDQFGAGALLVPPSTSSEDSVLGPAAPFIPGGPVPWGPGEDDGDPPSPDEPDAPAPGPEDPTAPPTGTGDDPAPPSAPGDPSGGTDGPSSGTDDPSAGTDGPSAGTDNPSGGTDDPSGGTDGPSSGTDGPSAGTDSPSSGTDDPSAGTDSPSTGTDGPSAGTDDSPDSEAPPAE